MPFLFIIGGLIVGIGATVFGQATGTVHLPSPEAWWYFDLGNVNYKFLGYGDAGKEAATQLLASLGAGQHVVSLKDGILTSQNGHQIYQAVQPGLVYAPPSKYENIPIP